MQDSCSLEYRGERIAHGDMDAKSVARAIVAFSDYVDVYALETYGQDAKALAKVKGFRGESFDIDFVIEIAGVVQTFVATGPSIGEVARSIGECLTLLRHLGGQPAQATEQVSAASEQGIAITNQSGQVVVCPNSVVNIVSSEKGANALDGFARAPISDGAASELHIVGGDGDISLEVGPQASDIFTPIDLGQHSQLTQHVKLGLSIESLSFREGLKWRFSDGQSNFTAAVEDEAFLASVDAGEPFAKGDVLVAEVRVTQADKPGGLKVERAITKVLRHRRKADHSNFDLFE